MISEIFEMAFAYFLHKMSFKLILFCIIIIVLFVVAIVIYSRDAIEKFHKKKRNRINKKFRS